MTSRPIIRCTTPEVKKKTINKKTPPSNKGLVWYDETNFRGHTSMTRQCVADRRSPDVQTLSSETTAWAEDVSLNQRTIDWQMKLNDARCRLKPVYPKI